MNLKTEIKIFIGYAREDYEEVTKIYDYLNSLESVKPWLDKKCLLPGADWEEEIRHEIAHSRFVMLILSNNAVNKQGFVQQEVKVVLDRLKNFPPRSIFVIPVRINYCRPRYRELHKLNWIDLFEGWEEGLEKINQLVSKEKGLVAAKQQERSDKDIQHLKKELTEELLINLQSYVKWLNMQDLFPIQKNQEQQRLIFSEWTKQAKGSWLEELMEYNGLQLENGKMIFTDTGMQLLEGIWKEQ